MDLKCTEQGQRSPKQKKSFRMHFNSFINLHQHLVLHSHGHQRVANSEKGNVQLIILKDLISSG